MPKFHEKVGQQAHHNDVLQSLFPHMVVLTVHCKSIVVLAIQARKKRQKAKAKVKDPEKQDKKSEKRNNNQGR